MIFSTKNREPLLVGDAAARLYAYIGGICRNSGNVLTAAGGMPDHVHLLVALGKQSCVADVVRDIKSNSSGWIHKEFSSLRGFAWQTGYGAFGASHSSVGEAKAGGSALTPGRSSRGGGENGGPSPAGGAGSRTR